MISAFTIAVIVVLWAGAAMTFAALWYAIKGGPATVPDSTERAE